MHCTPAVFEMTCKLVEGKKSVLLSYEQINKLVSTICKKIKNGDFLTDWGISTLVARSLFFPFKEKLWLLLFRCVVLCTYNVFYVQWIEFLSNQGLLYTTRTIRKKNPWMKLIKKYFHFKLLKSYAGEKYIRKLCAIGLPRKIWLLLKNMTSRVKKSKVWFFLMWRLRYLQLFFGCFYPNNCNDYTQIL